MLTAAAAPLADATALGAITAEEARTGRGQHAALQLVIDECAFAMFIYESLKGLSEIIHRALAELPLGECRVAFLRVYWYTSYVAATSARRKPALFFTTQSKRELDSSVLEPMVVLSLIYF